MFKFMNEKIAAVVVTYNREKLLLECLEAMKNQSQRLDAIYIIDNKSDISTPELLKSEGWINDIPAFSVHNNEIQNLRIQNRKGLFVNVIYIRKKENDGGAGGFYEGIRQAYESGYKWIWIMDDDVVPEKDSLEELINSTKYVNNFGFLCSRVVGINGISMNMPEICNKKGINFYPVWDELLHYGLVRIKSATFVSVLLPSEVISKVGYPIREMFIWGDDTEYTLRISKNYPCYLAGKSVVCHKRSILRPPSIKHENDKKRIKMQFYVFRNNMYCIRKHRSNYQFLVYMLELINKFLFLFVRLRIYASYILLKGTISGMTFNPPIQLPCK